MTHLRSIESQGFECSNRRLFSENGIIDRKKQCFFAWGLKGVRSEDLSVDIRLLH